jgi:hypothetical protein
MHTLVKGSHFENEIEIGLYLENRGRYEYKMGNVQA